LSFGGVAITLKRCDLHGVMTSTTFAMLLVLEGERVTFLGVASTLWHLFSRKKCGRGSPEREFFIEIIKT
jgi:hypothetical protein